MPPAPSATHASTAAPDPVSRGDTRWTDRAPARRVPAQGPGPPGLVLRFTDRERADLPEVELRAGEVTLLEGRAGVEAIRHRLVIDCATRGRSIVQIVGGNRLDSTALARRAQALGLDPGYVLRASVVARAFTAYQLSVLVEERLPAHLAADDEAALAVVTDPLALYTDEDVRANEGRSLATQALASIRETAREQACPLLVVQPRRPHRRPAPGRRDRSPASPKRTAELLELVRAHADTYLRLRPLEGTGPREGPDGHVIERPRRGERYRVAKPRAEQARLDRFASTTREVPARG